MFNPIQPMGPSAPISSSEKTPIQTPAYQGKSWLNSPASDLTNYDLKMFAHEMGDPFIKGTSLEGNDPWYTLIRFKEVMGKIAGNLPWVDSCLGYAAELRTISDFSGVSKLAKRITTDVSALKPGESIWLPGGWGNPKGGHAMLYQVSREASGKFSFTVFNTGGGIENHPKIITYPKTQEKYQTFLTYEEIPAEKLCNEDVFKALIQLKTVQRWDASVSSCADNIYEGILPYLGGKRKAAANPGAEGEDYQKAQRSGTCSMKDIFAAFHKTVLDTGKKEALSIYKHDKYLYEKQSLIDAFAKYESLPWNKSWHKLLTDASSKFSRMLLKIDLPEDELLNAKASLLEMEEKLRDKKANRGLIHPPAPIQSFNGDHLGLSSSGFDQVGTKPKASLNFSFKAPAVSSESIDLPKVPSFPTDPKDALGYLKETKEKLEAFKQSCEWSSPELTESVNRCIKEWAIPEKGAQSDFWGQVPESEITDCLDHIFQISRMLMSAKASREESKESIISSYTALAIADKLARRDPKNHLEGQKVNFYDFLEFADSKEVWLFSPVDQSRTEKLVEYFNEEFDLTKQVKEEALIEAKKNSLFSYTIEAEKNSIVFSFGKTKNKTSKVVRIDEKATKSSVGLSYYKAFLSHPPESLAKLPIEKQVATLCCETLAVPGILPKSVKLLRQMTMCAWSSILEGSPTRLREENCEFKTSQYNDYRNPQHKDLYEIADSIQRSSLRSFDSVYSSEPDFSTASQNLIQQEYEKENSRETGVISLNVSDEVVRAIAFFEENPLDLLDNQYQQISLTAHIFRPRRLLSQLKAEPRVALKLLSFINLRLNYFKGSGRWETAAYFAKLGFHVNAFIEEAKKEAPEKFARIENELQKNQVDFRKTLLEDILPRTGGSDRIHVLTTLLSLPTGSLLDYCMDFFALNMGNPKSVPPHLFSEVKNLFKDQKARNQVLNHITLVRNLKTPESDWEGEYPLFKASNYQINIQTGEVFEEGKPLVSNDTVSAWATKLTRLEGVDKTWVEDPFVFFKNAYGITKMSCDKESQTVQIERKINGIPYLYLSDFPAEIRVMLPYDIRHDENLKIWFSEDANDPHYLIERKDSSAFYIRLEKREDKYYIKSVSLDKEEKHLLINPWGLESMKPFSAFEDKEYILCSAKKGSPDKVNQISLPRYALNFHVGASDKAFCKEIPGYFLAEDQTSFEGKWPTFLLLENGSGHQKLLVPKATLFRKEDEKTPFAPEIETSEANQKAYIAYDVEEVSGKEELIPSSLGDKIYLASMAMAKKEYRKAIHLLQTCYALRVYKNEESSVLHSMLEAKEGHPSAIIIRLLVVLLLRENRLKYDPSGRNPLNYKQIEKDYRNYLNMIDSFTERKLSPSEEESILLTLDGLTSEIVLERNKIVLEGKKEELGFRSVDFKKPTPSTLQPLRTHSNDIDTFFNVLEAPFQTPEKMINLSTSEFRNCFSKFYEWARSGTLQEKEKLRRIVSFAKGSAPYNDRDKDVKRYVSLLSAMLNASNVKKFPTLKELEAIPYKDRIKAVEKLNELVGTTASLNEVASLVKDAMSFKTKSLKPLPKVSSVKVESVSELPLGLETLDQTHQKRANELLTTFFLAKEIPSEKEVELKLVTDQEKLAQLQKDLLSFYQLRPKVRVAYSLLDPLALQGKLKEEMETLETKLKKDQSEILTFINHIPDDMKVTSHLMQLGKKRKKLNFEEAVTLFERDVGYSEKTFLREKEIPHFENQMGAYLINATRLEQLKRALLDARKIVATSDPKEKELLEQRIGEELATERQYLGGKLPFKRADIPRSFLVFEYRNQVLLRKKQAVTLQEILEKPEGMQLLAQLGTGSGKSKVLASLLEWLRGKCSRMVINFWPDSLYNDNKEDIRKQTETTFAQRADTFEFDRQTKTSPENLNFINRELSLAAQEKRQLNAIPSSAQSLELRLIEALRDQDLQAVEELKKPNNLFLNSEAHIDEGHVNMAPKREVNFTVGEPRLEARENVELIQELYRFLVEDREMKAQFQLQDNLQHLAQEGDFKEKIALHFAGFFKISESEKSTFIDYVTGKGSEIPSFVNTHPRKGEIGLLRGELTLLLPDSLTKCANVHFGLSHLPDGPEYAIPYDANDSPVEGAQYDNIHEALNKTFQVYLSQGLSKKHLWKLVCYLRDNAQVEARRERINPSLTASALFYQTHFPKEMGDLFSLTEREVEKFSNEIQKRPVLALYYVTNLVAPRIDKYTYTLKSNSQNFRSMFGSLMTMTATPGSEHAYGPEVAYRADIGSDEVMLHALKTKCQGENAVHTLNASHPKEISKEIFEKLLLKGTQFRMLIDIGALFKGISNLEVARGVLAHFDQIDPGAIQGVVFYHDDQKMVLRKGHPEPIPFNLCKIKPERLFTYADNKRIFGMDVKQMPQAKGIATFDTHNDKDDILQGVGRLREFLKEQSVEFVITEKTKEAIGQKDKRADFDLILGHAILNQATKEKESTFRSFKQQMQNEVRQVIMRKIKQAKTAEESLAIFANFEKDLVQERSQDPFLLYGQIEQEMSGTAALHKFNKDLIEEVKVQKGFSKEERNQILLNLGAYEKKIESLKGKIPETVLEMGIDTGTEVQQSVKVAAETKTETKTEKGKELPLRESTPWSPALNLFEGNWFKPMQVTINKISRLTPNIFAAMKKVHKFNPEDSTGWIVEKFANKFGEKTLVPFIVVLSTLGLPLLVAIAALYLLAQALFVAALAVTYPIDYLRYRINKVTPKTGCDIYSVSEVLRRQNEKTLFEMQDFYKTEGGGELLLTNNFCALKSRELAQTKSLVPLGPEQKILHEVLVIEDLLPDGKKKYTLIMGDQDTDAHFWRNQLLADKGTHDRKICLFDLHSGIVQDSHNPFDTQSLTSNKTFQTLLVKAKLYNGDIDYTDEQLEIVKAFEPATKVKLWEFFQKSLVYKEERRSRLSGSAIESVLSPTLKASRGAA